MVASVATQLHPIDMRACSRTFPRQTAVDNNNFMIIKKITHQDSRKKNIFPRTSFCYTNEPCRETRHSQGQNSAACVMEVANMRQAYLFFLVSGFPSSCRNGPASIDICHVLQCTLFAI